MHIKRLTVAIRDWPPSYAIKRAELPELLDAAGAYNEPALLQFPECVVERSVARYPEPSGVSLAAHRCAVALLRSPVASTAKTLNAESDAVASAGLSITSSGIRAKRGARRVADAIGDTE